MKKTGLYRLLMVGAILVVLLNIGMARRALTKLFNAQGMLAHTLEVITHTETMSQEMRRADSAVRGFILTGSSKFEDRYRTSLGLVTSELDNVQQLTADSASQQKRIAYLRTRVAAKKGVLDAGIAMRHGRPVDAITPAELQPVFEEHPDGGPSVYYSIQQVEGEERRLLVDRTAETQVARRQVWVSFIVASVLDILLLIAAFEQLIRAHRDRLKIEESSREIAMLNSELQAMNADLEARVEQRTHELELANKELEAFSYSVSHDLRAPLRTIDGFSLALQEDFAEALNAEGHEHLNRVRNGVQRMGALIDALLQLSRVSRTEVQREHVDISQLATLVFQELEVGDSQRKVAFFAEPGIVANADARLVRIALENLMGNAWKFTSRTEDARIEFGRQVDIGPDGGRTIYFVRDNGAGFDMHYVDRLFTAFQRLHGDRDFKGSGIGLATVSRIIRRHHGTIWAEAEVGKGSTFFFTLQADARRPAIGITGDRKQA